MTSLLTLPVEWLAKLLAGGRADKIQQALGKEPYIDVGTLAKLNGTSEAEAEAELERAVKAGRLEKMWLYFGEDAPFKFVFPPTMLNKSIPLSQIDDFNDYGDQELLVSSLRAKEVYVATTGELTHAAHAT